MLTEIRTKRFCFRTNQTSLNFWEHIIENVRVKEMVDSKEDSQPQEESQGGFLYGAGFSLLFGLLLVTIGFTFCFGPGCGVWGWNIMFIAFGLPVAAGSLALMWKRSGKKAMVNGAKTIFIIGCMVAIGVIIWFVTVLNSLGS